ncbi:hypothetical protein MBLNU459_g5301t1 [Dothideomycetes sp. NU459]
MLSWLVGGKTVDGANDFDTFLEPPETPAPVFAYRALKHAIIGTPQPAQISDISYMEDVKEQEAAERTSSNAGRVATASKQIDAATNVVGFTETISMSPTKPNGILMTPGTTRRNKTVSFGVHVVDNEGRKQTRSGLPNTIPGKFPSPFTPRVDISGLSDASANSRNPTKLTAALQEVRDSSQKARSDKRIIRSRDDTDITLDLMEPRSQSGKYWKQEYESYAEKTQREMKKLVIKQRAAKSFAKTKDTQVIDLSNKLRDEKKKVEKLEAKAIEFASRIEDYQEKLQQRSGHAPAQNPSTELADARDEIARLRSENHRLRRDLDSALGRKSQLLASPKPKPAERRATTTAPEADIWADVGLSSPFVADVPAQSPRRVTADTTPLKARDINTLDFGERQSQAQSPRRTPRPSAREHKTSTPRSLRNSAVLPEDSLDISLALPQPSPEPAARRTPRNSGKRVTAAAAAAAAAEMTIDDLLEKYSPVKTVPDVTAADSPLPAFDRLALPMGMSTAGVGQKKGSNPVSATAPTIAKENVPPPSSFAGDKVMKRSEEAKVVAETDGDKAKRKAISDDRKAAAAARIAARRAAK